ncbi:MAG: chromosome segregation protein SMC [bacterium]
MRLKCIKLAGFKSFVDPTTVNFPSNLCAVVGPNGCGKSNIIDAVRWVMGETSAKNLRGESMSDVIFNGSGGRKPVGQASIELVFDNSDATLGGEYARYAEISIRRKVTRDGQSNYYLNGNKCRRRDITDIFLGTGLGPRSYAIIEQGMISRLIEARPEELRIFIEEAAGISKYKERRRDTENRMKRTQENLERLTDIREELGRQIQRLERQARAAEKYTELKAEERKTNAELQALRWREIDQRIQEQKRETGEQELTVESLVTDRSACDTSLEKLRGSYTEFSDAFNEIQGRFYGAGAEVARLEQAIQHAEDRARDIRREMEETERNFEESRQHLAHDQERATALASELATILPQLESAKTDESQATSQLQETEQRMQEWQSTWDEFNQAAAQPRQQSEVQQSRIQHVEQLLRRLSERSRKLEQELDTIRQTPVEQELEKLTTELSDTEASMQSAASKVEHIESRIAEGKIELDTVAGSLNRERTRLQEISGRKASLEALQQAALSVDSAAGDWIEQHGLAGNKRLAETLSVEKGWEKAVETVLGDYLQAVCLDNFADLLGDVGQLRSGQLALVAGAGAGAAAGSDARKLASKVTSGCPAGLLDQVFVADDLSGALAMRDQLQPQESVVTRDGIWLGADWLRVTREVDQQAGILARKQELESLGDELKTLSAEVEALESRKASLDGSQRNLEKERKEVAEKQSQIQKAYTELRSRVSANEVRIRQFTERKSALTQEISDVDEQQKQEEKNLAEARQMLEASIDQMDDDRQKREALLKTRDEVRSGLDQVRQAARHARDRHHELEIREKSISTQKQSLDESVSRLEQQVSRLSERRDALQAANESKEDPTVNLREQLESKLEHRLKVETEMAEARKQLEAVEHEMRETEKRRMSTENQLQSERTVLEQMRVKSQEMKTRAMTIAEQIAEGQFDLQTLLDELADENDLKAWEEKLALVSNRIQRLGPINLAAIDEYKIEAERKTYLDAQNAELVEALETLESAIRKIDKETRTRFKETFDSLNRSLQDLFPRVFGGGHAYLEMTGEDLLDTGVAIMARPPGKKNTTIHLLSGGEKAMTAIALVFSIFQLNPAPFCMLDEVDAPLDDANVGRYARMVHEMSEKVQFIYITHNKISMEIAHQLMGVTMHEPGVSRLVTVDVDEAAEMAGA